jgi:hypothetical protein
MDKSQNIDDKWTIFTSIQCETCSECVSGVRESTKKAIEHEEKKIMDSVPTGSMADRFLSWIGIRAC